MDKSTQFCPPVDIEEGLANVGDTTILQFFEQHGRPIFEDEHRFLRFQHGPLTAQQVYAQSPGVLTVEKVLLAISEAWSAELEYGAQNRIADVIFVLRRLPLESNSSYFSTLVHTYFPQLNLPTPFALEEWMAYATFEYGQTPPNAMRLHIGSPFYDWPRHIEFPFDSVIVYLQAGIADYKLIREAITNGISPDMLLASTAQS